MNSSPTPLLAVLTVAALGALGGCSGTSSPSAPTAPASASSSPGHLSPASDVVTVTDAWVKAAESGMTAAFGTVRNPSDHEVTVVAVTTPASARVELHETVANDAGQMTMREKQGGFTVPAAGEMLLEPGGNHIMLMDLATPVVAGEDVVLTFTFSDASTLEVTAPAKDYAGANESYDEGDESSGHMGDE